MKKIIDKKFYDTETAQEIARLSEIDVLYKTKKGNYFMLYNTNDICVVTEKEAIEFLENGDFYEELLIYFPDAIEEG